MGIEEGEVFRSKDKAPVGILQLLRAIEEESELCLGTGAVCTAQSQKTELIGAMHAWEHALAVLKVIEANQRPSVHEIGEKDLSRVVGGDAGRNNHPDPSRRTANGSRRLREDGVLVDFAYGCQLEPPAGTSKLAQPLYRAFMRLP